MATINDGADSFVAASASGIAKNIRVKLNSNRKLEVAAAADREIGVTDYATTNDSRAVKVHLSNGPGSVEVEAFGAVSPGQVVKRAADGKVAVSAAGTEYGIAYGSVDSTGGMIEVYPF